MYERKTTQASRIGNPAKPADPTTVPSPIVPDGDGWEIENSALNGHTVAWFWRRKITPAEIIKSQVAAGALLNAQALRASSLAAREREVVQHIGTGVTIRATAKRLGISPKTVETHRARIYSKLDIGDVNVSSQVELAIIAIRAGIVTL